LLPAVLVDDESTKNSKASYQCIFFFFNYLLICVGEDWWWTVWWQKHFFSMKISLNCKNMPWCTCELVLYVISLMPVSLKLFPYHGLCLSGMVNHERWLYCTASIWICNGTAIIQGFRLIPEHGAQDPLKFETLPHAGKWDLLI